MIWSDTTFAGEVKDFDPTYYMPRKEARRIARATQLSLAAASQAMADAGLPPDWTEGCIAVTDDEIEEIYAMVRNGTPIMILP